MKGSAIRIRSPALPHCRLEREQSRGMPSRLSVAAAEANTVVNTEGLLVPPQARPAGRASVAW
jgi:hypothetical protein